MSRIMRSESSRSLVQSISVVMPNNTNKSPAVMKIIFTHDKLFTSKNDTKLSYFIWKTIGVIHRTRFIHKLF